MRNLDHDFLNRSRVQANGIHQDDYNGAFDIRWLDTGDVIRVIAEAAHDGYKWDKVVVSRDDRRPDSYEVLGITTLFFEHGQVREEITGDRIPTNTRVVRAAPLP